MKKTLLSLVALVAVAVASVAFAAQLNKTLASAFTAPAGTYATALSGNVAPGNFYGCSIAPDSCRVVSVRIILKSADQANIGVQAKVSNVALSLTQTTQADGSLKFEGSGYGTGTSYAVKLNVQSNSGSPIVIDPAAGDALSLRAVTLPDSL